MWLGTGVSCFSRKSACSDQQNSDWSHELLTHLSPALCGSAFPLTLTPHLQGWRSQSQTSSLVFCPAGQRSCRERTEDSGLSPSPPHLLTLPLKGFVLPTLSLSCLPADSAPRPVQVGGGSHTSIPFPPRPAVKTPASPCTSLA